ncbi:P2X purinoceptor 5-like isoform X2 [Paramisgurnus dabryanus]|uniref:P2X purinoceptor 5-like isoform X2 n=1 Tax=Paramisgurnus dabryanus TaxID=90735 RepID=UPI0031F3DEA3
MDKVGSLFAYKTAKYVVAKNKTIGILYRLFQLIVLGYLIGWVFLKNKKYQITDEIIQSSVKTKVKGYATITTSDGKEEVWGPEDYVIPQQGDNVFFVTTNLVDTPNQTLGYCPESPSAIGFNCTEDADCKQSKFFGNGKKTGICLNITNSNFTGICEIYGWCPPKTKDRPKTPVLSEAENFILQIRNNIRFPKFNFTGSNFKGKSIKQLNTCFYDEIKEPHCPVFRLGDIVQKAGYSFQEMAVYGGSIGIMVEWQCDLDKGWDCNPQYSFARLGNSPTHEFKFRYVRYFTDANGGKYRTHYSVSGIHFDVMVFGMAGMFGIIPTIVNLGSGFAFMGAGAYICDIILLYMMKKRTLYRVLKFETVKKYGRMTRT